MMTSGVHRNFSWEGVFEPKARLPEVVLVISEKRFQNFVYFTSHMARKKKNSQKKAKAEKKVVVVVWKDVHSGFCTKRVGPRVYPFTTPPPD